MLVILTSEASQLTLTCNCKTRKASYLTKFATCPFVNEIRFEDETNNLRCRRSSDCDCVVESKSAQDMVTIAQVDLVLVAEFPISIRPSNWKIEIEYVKQTLSKVSVWD
ncbi:hypothetical protein Btru_076927 [Bulinus truncatus]|nr:hypothetical protein Btru_076927 [Bulinus truncatus]